MEVNRDHQLFGYQYLYRFGTTGGRVNDNLINYPFNAGPGGPQQVLEPLLMRRWSVK